MIYSMCPLIDSYDLEKEIKLQYDIEVDVVDLFFDYECNEINYLGIGEQWDEDEDEDEFFPTKKLIKQHLRDILPKGTDTVIIHVDF